MDRIFTKVYIAPADAHLPQDLWQRLYAQASAQRQAKADRLRFEKDRRLCLAADGLLRFALAENGIAEYTVLTGEIGKPYLDGNPLYFNLSHSGDHVLCAVSSAPVGCDIELTATPDLRLAQRFFCENEARWIQSAREEKDRADRFYRLWTLKESYMKAIGKGLSQPLNSVCFALTDSSATLPADSRWSFREYSLPGYRCAVCAQTDQISELIPVAL